MDVLDAGFPTCAVGHRTVVVLKTAARLASPSVRADERASASIPGPDLTSDSSRNVSGVLGAVLGGILPGVLAPVSRRFRRDAGSPSFVHRRLPALEFRDEQRQRAVEDLGHIVVRN